ncbi:MAG TPA: hypothetical protein VLC95_10375, partial [Anaerolineae bacterium]|nr:hypothetical protein [Anaerolineae bacterium]
RRLDVGWRADREAGTGIADSVGTSGEGNGMVSVKDEEWLFPFYDWQPPAPAGEVPGRWRQATLLDTTLRDGIQSVLSRYPSLEQKLLLVDLLMELGIDAFDVGFPVSNPRHKEHTHATVAHIARRNPAARLVCLARSKCEDVRAIADLGQAAGTQMEALVFVGSSPIRLMVEQWNVGAMVRWATETIDCAIHEGLVVNFACEDATRSEPETLRVLHTAALEHGASRFTIPDTVGICSVASTTRIVQFLRADVIQGRPIGIDWHGHNDRGLAVANAMAALAAGADCVHTTVLGIGERCGNVALEPMVANLYYEGGRAYRMAVLPRLVEWAALVLDEPVPTRHPVVGRNAYSTAAGIHGAAILKASRLAQPELIANIYAGVDPRLTSRAVEVQVGPLSGSANVEWAAANLGIPFSAELAGQALDRAREVDRILTDEEIVEIARRVVTGAV